MTNPKSIPDVATSVTAAADAMKAYRESSTVGAVRTALASNALNVTRGLDADLRAYRALQVSPPAEFMRSVREMKEKYGSALEGIKHAESPLAEIFRNVQEALRPELASARALQELSSTARSTALEHFASARLPAVFEDSARIKTIPITRLLREFQNSPSLAAVARIHQWADQLASSHTELSALMSGSLSEIGRVQRAAGAVSTLARPLDAEHWASRPGFQTSFGLDLATTRLKLSMLAAAGDVLGFAAGASCSAYANLFGNWHTRPDLPRRFWRDPQLRRRLYVEADVDRGLIEATPAAAVELVVNSGLAAGLAADPSPVALLSVADVTLTIRASDVRGDIYKIITAFEQELRRFITVKMQEFAGPKWFKQKVDEALFGKAKAGRSAALANGEKDSELIAYLDLGDLQQIMTRKDNWNQVFSRVFPSHEKLSVDLQAMIAVRRPTMHARSLDAVRLVEMIFVISRLTKWIEEDGQWRLTAETDH